MSTPILKAAFISGLTAAGAEVIDLGTVTTPMVLFATTLLKADGGAMITASHNPKEFNGIKLNNSAGVPISYEGGLNKIEVRACDGMLTKSTQAATQGTVTPKSVFMEYENFILAALGESKIPMKIVVDAGNGVAGIHAEILEKAGCKVVSLYCEPDGNFPHHQANPEKAENLKDLRAKVKEEKADLGVAYDGDGDRVGFVDEKGNIVSINEIFGLLIKDALERSPKGKIIYDVECSKAIDDIIRANGGVPLISKTGHTYITQRMLQEKAIFAGEKSGHYYFAETNAADDGLFATVRLLNYLVRKKQKLSAAVKGFPKYISAYHRISVPDEKKFSMVEQIKKEVADCDLKPITIDGVRVNFENGWALIRTSNTESKLSVTYEASTKEDFRKIKTFVKQLLKKVGVSLVGVY